LQYCKKHLIKVISGSEVDAVKQKFHSYFCKNKGFKLICQISYVLEGEHLVDSERLQDLSVTSFVVSVPRLIHVMWNVHFVNTNHSCQHNINMTRGSLQH
jgi:hypothetical protein